VNKNGVLVFRTAVGVISLSLVLAPPVAGAQTLGDTSELTSLSPECRAPGSMLYTLAPLRQTKRALKEKRAIRVYAFGSSSTTGAGASSVRATYPVRLELELEKTLRGLDFEVINLGLSGELASGTAERIRIVVAAKAPDLVIWQVGTNDALARVEPETFKRTLMTTLQWLAERRIDVALVDPQYTSGLGKDETYSHFVEIIEQTARLNQVLLVRRFEAMQHLARQRSGEDKIYLASDQFHLNDLGYRCMAEHAARAITLSLIQVE
jgi:acyl-CoA thioesterase-1